MQLNSDNFHLGEAAEEVGGLIKLLIKGKSVSYEYKLEIASARSLEVIGDAPKLRQILTNLLSNSAKFTEKGIISLTLRKFAEDEKTLTVEFIVQDTGFGIDAVVQDHLFKPFVQAPNSASGRLKGTGLGLTIVKEFAELMGGEVALKSELGRGSTVTCRIPFRKQRVSSASKDGKCRPTPPAHLMRTGTLQPAEAEAWLQEQQDLLVPGTAKTLSDLDRAGKQILIADDNEINRHIALRLISKRGFSVNLVEDGRSALDFLIESSDNEWRRPDLILMDLQMPRMDGYEATQAIRKGAMFDKMPWVRGIPIIAMTASAIPEEEAKCRSSGMNDFILKPLRAESLDKIVVKWLARKPLG
ncbi:hypothetical protein MPH_08335 [Macrophomina phaseolina MS6]|uniref:histidine kinase n=1 Tax=Macrophomina phaseolina (strain MS6) TaxID=1126212 RepID=K2QXA1_MACPH|nr:hypothetical protein MPH_08335 [Macrophomina phaseolina MS6]